jgi:hypothetical protein
LSEVRAAEEALAQLSVPKPLSQRTIGKPLGDKIVVLAGRLPQIWADPATTDAQRKALLRCLVEKVILDRGERDVARVRIAWRGGAVSDIAVKMRVNAVANLTRGTEMRDRALDLARAGILTMRSPQSSAPRGTAHPTAPTRSCRSPCNGSGSAVASK